MKVHLLSVQHFNSQWKSSGPQNFCLPPCPACALCCKHGDRWLALSAVLNTLTHFLTHPVSCPRKLFQIQSVFISLPWIKMFHVLHFLWNKMHVPRGIQSSLSLRRPTFHLSVTSTLYFESVLRFFHPHTFVKSWFGSERLPIFSLIIATSCTSQSCLNVNGRITATSTLNKAEKLFSHTKANPDVQNSITSYH